MNRWTVIVNPVSGRGQGRRLARAIVDQIATPERTVAIVETSRAGEAQALASAPGMETIIAVGGDGTINEVLNGLSPPFPTLGVIPCGTGNTLAKELRLPHSVPNLVHLFQSNRSIVWDLAVERHSGRRFLLFLSAGYDAHVVHRFHAQRTGPVYQWEYALWGLKCILGFDPPKIGVEIDGRIITESASWIQISNVSAYGGPLVFTPNAKPSDGALEVMVFHAQKQRDIPRMFLRAGLHWLAGWNYPLHDLSFHPARKVRLWSTDNRPVPTQVDGDPGGFLPSEVEIVPGGLRVITP